ncbi:hypothetical protein MANES_03G127300v8 [Manihot esculenta]|uniref:Uncharacterized protein n=1 Tax=Manihot esculenta TaxID=3983 RepID=A0ACB7HZZ9_MANES|nr:hypothetical protein MANES_03G127300v8 [Manihot esculenta]
MGTEIEIAEDRLKSFLAQLKAECGVFERIVYKNKNQHRRSSYFQYLLKVRRDLRLLQSAKLDELLDSCFHVITGRKPQQKLHFLESLKWRKVDRGVPNFMERLLGAARILSQMVEPMLKAATEVSVLLARSFFMGFSLTILALLARLRVLVQQILLDVVSVFNTVYSLSQKKQSIKITKEGIEVFREYYPTNKEFVTLECVWDTDKFVLLERTQKSDTESQVGTLGEASIETAALQYKSIESFLGDDSDFEDLNEGPAKDGVDRKEVEGGVDLGDNPDNAGTPDEKLPPEGDMLPISSSSPSSKTLTPRSSSASVAFVSVKRPAPSTAAFISVKRPVTSTSSTTGTDLHSAESEMDSGNKEESFFNLLTGGSLKDSLF